MNIGLLGGADASRQSLSFFYRFGGDFLAAGIDLRLVVIRPASQRDAPISHGALRIQLRGIAERARCFIVIERVHQRKALVEIALRHRI